MRVTGIHATTETARTVAEVDRPPTTRRRRLEPAHLLVPVVASTALFIAARPIADIDTFWHVLIGQEVLAKHSVTNLGNSWALFGSGHHWQTTQWMSEVGMYLLHKQWGWYGITWVSLLISAMAVTGLAIVTIRGRPARAGAMAFALVALPLSSAFISRPEIVSLIFLIGLGELVRRMLLSLRLPHPILTTVFTALWANLHGYWVLAPAFIGLAIVGSLVDEWRSRSDILRRGLPTLVASAIGGCITPLGVAGYLMPLKFRAATSMIQEWAPTTYTNPISAGFLVLVMLMVWSWARCRRAVSRSEIILVLGALAFSTLAMRNVYVSALVLAPTVADRLAAVFPQRSRVGRREGVALVVAICLISVVGVSAAVEREIHVDPLSRTTPLRIAAYLHDLPGTKRILNDYNVSGPLLAYGSSGIRLAIDGRADRDGAAWIRQYQDALALQPGWQKVLQRVKPDYAVLDRKEALAYELVAHRGWKIILKDGNYELLKPG